MASNFDSIASGNNFPAVGEIKSENKTDVSDKQTLFAVLQFLKKNNLKVSHEYFIFLRSTFFVIRFRDQSQSLFLSINLAVISNTLRGRRNFVPRDVKRERFTVYGKTLISFALVLASNFGDSSCRITVGFVYIFYKRVIARTYIQRIGNSKSKQ